MPDAKLKDFDGNLSKALSPENFQGSNLDCTLAKGAKIGDYEVLCLLGNSGIGELYLVRHAATRKRFALKLLPPAASSDPEFDRRFSEGGVPMPSRLHQHMAHVHKAGCHSEELDYHYIVTDYIEGPGGHPLSLHDILGQRGRVSERQCKKIMLQICEALEYAHSCPSGAFVHSNLKPSNILFDPAGMAKVSDFETVAFLGKRYFRDIIRDCVSKGISQSIQPSHPPSEEENAPKPEGGVNGGAEKGGEEQTDAFLLLKGKGRLRIPDFGLFKLIGGSEYVKTLLKSARDLDSAPILEQTGDMVKEAEEKSFRRPDAPAAPRTPDSRALCSALETYDYMSPEQKGGQEVTPASNVYSAGLILYRMLTGRKMGGCWEAPSNFGVSRGWNAVLLKCLAREPEDRYKSATEMKAAIQSVRAKSETVLIASLSAAALLLIMAIAGAIAFGEHFDLNLKEFFKSEKAHGKLIELKGDPLKKFQARIRLEPEGAKATLSKDGQIVREIESLGPEGLEFLAASETYVFEAYAKGFLPFYAEFKPNPESKETAFKMSKAPSKKEYVWLKDPAKPKLGFPWRIRDLQMTLLPIEPGQFQAGCRLPAELRLPEEKPLAAAAVERPFWISEKEVTQAQFEEIMWKNPSFFRVPGVVTPVERVSWQEANEFCKRLTAREQTAGRLPDGFIFRLPTEIEWEYCARAGSDALYSFGDNPKDLASFGWQDRNSGSHTHPTGELQPNAWGLYDMHGNVWEWCADLMRQSKAGESSVRYVCRGGGWDSSAAKLRSSSRKTVETIGEPDTTVGFRVVLAPPDGPVAAP